MYTDKGNVSVSLYDLLEVDPSATSECIDSARGRAVALLTESWIRETGIRQDHLDAAWMILRHPQTRAAYDRAVASGNVPHPEQIVELVKPSENRSLESIVAQLSGDWSNLPPLPLNVSEVTMWNGGQEPPKYLPLVEMARHIAEEQVAAQTRKGRKQQRTVDTALHAGYRPTRAPARIFAILVSLAMLAVVGYGGFLIYGEMHKPLAGQVGMCVRLLPDGTIQKYVVCADRNDGQIVDFASMPSLCTSDVATQVIVEGVVQPYVWCIDYPKPVALG